MQWLVVFYPVALGCVAFVYWPRPAGSGFDPDLLPLPAKLVVIPLLVVASISSHAIAVFGPAWILHTFGRWSPELAMLVGTLLGLVLLFAEIAWLVAGDPVHGLTTIRQRLRAAAELLGAAGIPIAFVVGQIATFALGASAGMLAARALLTNIRLDPESGEGIGMLFGGVGGMLTMMAYVLLLMRWQDRRKKPTLASVSPDARVSRRRRR